jgi:hypothetical protein
MFGASARALVHPHDIESGGVGLGRNSMHVVRIAIPFKPVQQQRGLSGLSVRLPMAEPDQLSVRRRAEDPALRWKACY